MKILQRAFVLVSALAALAFSAVPPISSAGPGPAPALIELSADDARGMSPALESAASQPAKVLLYVRVKHDNPPRQVLPVAPETVPLSDRPGRSGKGPVIPINKAWRDFDAGLNSPRAFHWLLTPHNALVNTDYGPGEDPKAESITFGGNVLLIDQLVGHYGHVSSFDYSEAPPDSAQGMTYRDYPQYIQKVTAIDSRNAAIRNPGAALDVYFALLHRTDLWIDMDRVEVFPALPTTVRPQDWVTKGLRVHGSCQVPSPLIDGLYPSQTATLVSYVPRGSDVLGWVELPDGKSGCIALSYRGTDYTGWHMDTLPPVRPAK